MKLIASKTNTSVDHRDSAKIKSKKHAEFINYFKEEHGYLSIIEEFNIGSNLFIDIYLPFYKIAIELDGEQHYEYVEFFHKSILGFNESVLRDKKKDSYCKQNGIFLYRVRFDDQRSTYDIFQDILLKYNEFAKKPDGSNVCQMCLEDFNYKLNNNLCLVCNKKNAKNIKLNSNITRKPKYDKKRNGRKSS